MFGVLEELETAIDKVAASEHALDVERICQLAERVEFLKVRAIRDYDRSGAWQDDGFVSTAAALRTKCRMQHGVARGAVDLGRKLEDLTQVADAFGAGEISRQHAEAIVAGYTPERAAAFDQVEAELVTVARLVPPGKLRETVRGLTDALDGDGGASADQAEYAKNHLTFDKTFNHRFEPHGTFDAESGEIIATALEAEIEALKHDGETRPRPQRRADALTSICRWYLAEHDGVSERRRNQTRVSAVADLAVLTGADTVLLADVRAEAAHAGRLSRATLQRLACDAKISRVLTDGTSQILDVGRSTRNVSTAQWNALVARDRHCTAPGCTMPPGFCEAHHIWYWALGGPTNLANLRLLCWYHHRQEHINDAIQRK
jgi:hypothetical protein